MSGESKPNDWPSSKFRPKKSRLKWAAFFWRCIGDNFLSSRETAPETKYVIFQGANIAPRFTYTIASMRSRPSPHLKPGTLVRFSIGLEAVEDLRRDLQQAMERAFPA